MRDRSASRAERRWLERHATPDLSGRIASAATMLDAGAAIGVAAGLAMAMSHLGSSRAAMLPGLALCAVAGLVRGVLAVAASEAGARYAAAIKDRVRSDFLSVQFCARFGTREPVGAAMALAVEAIEDLDGYYARVRPAARTAGLAPVLILAAMAVASPVAAAIVLVTLLLFVVAMILAGGAAAEASRRQFATLRRLSALFVDRLRALPIVIGFEAEAAVERQLQQASAALAERTLSVLKVAFLSAAALEFFAALCVALVAVYCGFSLLHLLPFPAPERLTFGEAMFVLALAPEAYLPMRRLAAAYHERQQAETAAGALAARLDSAHAPLPDETSAPVGLAPPELRFRAVTVRFPDRDAAVLDEFDLHVRPGESVALRGPTGSGKTTILRLALGLVVPTCGEVSAGAYANRDLRAAWAGQTPLVVPGTLAENIALARPSAEPGAVLSAARAVGLAAQPVDLLRRIDERGGGLSGGERRRLALARAMLSAAPLLLLDEPTAGLDAASEGELLPVLRAAMRGRTTLLATHSEAVAALADRIVEVSSR